jgi:hypothetical protein
MFCLRNLDLRHFSGVRPVTFTHLYTSWRPSEWTVVRISLQLAKNADPNLKNVRFSINNRIPYFVTPEKYIYKTASICFGMSASPRVDHEKS